ncbi:MAG TPA: PD-(D/E)XK motif protein [Solirubrobacteraceae bacterium]|jgi:hypothetical protein
MPVVSGDSWRALPDRSPGYAELAADAVPGLDRAFLAVDHEGVRHLLLGVDHEIEPVTDERSRGLRVLTRALSVQGQRERHFVDVMCTAVSGQEVFNLVSTAILEAVERGVDPPDAVRGTLARWRRFWGAAPTGGLTGEEIRGLFGELWFLAVWLLPHGHDQVAHWLGPTGARHDFGWPGLALEAKATTSVRGHVHRINGVDQLDPPADGRLLVFSLRMREEPTASNALVSLIETITTALGDDSEALDAFESRLAQTGYSPLLDDHYAEVRFRIVNERLYEVADGFPRLSEASFAGGLPAGVERVEYEVNLDACPQLIVASSPAEFAAPGAPATAPPERAEGGGL